MKETESDFTTKELDALCQLYMDCKLSVLEEKELEYLLSRTSLTSDAIEDVRALMGSGPGPRVKAVPLKRKRSMWRSPLATAAAVALVVAAALVYPLSHPGGSSADGEIYIAAYSNGRPLTGKAAESAICEAMARADSLMQYAAVMEHEAMQRAEQIVNRF